MSQTTTTTCGLRFVYYAEHTRDSIHLNLLPSTIWTCRLSALFSNIFWYFPMLSKTIIFFGFYWNFTRIIPNFTGLSFSTEHFPNFTFKVPNILHVLPANIFFKFYLPFLPREFLQILCKIIQIGPEFFKIWPNFFQNISIGTSFFENFSNFTELTHILSKFSPPI